MPAKSKPRTLLGAGLLLVVLGLIAAERIATHRGDSAEGHPTGTPHADAARETMDAPLPSKPSRQADSNPTQAERIAALRELGGTVTYDSIFNSFVANKASEPKQLRVSLSRLTDAELVHLKGLKGLTELILDGTEVTDAGLAHLKGMTKLTALDLDGTKITDAGLVHLEGMTGLAALGLDDTAITDAGLARLRGMTSLAILTLDNTEVTDAGLVHLEGMTQLSGLILDGTKVTDEGLVHLEGMTNLASLALQETAVTDEGLVHLKGMNGLLYLFLENSRVTETGVATLEAALPNCGVILELSPEWTSHFNERGAP